MAIITIAQNFGPAVGEQVVSFPVKAVQYADGSLVSGHSVMDIDLMNAYHEYMVCDDECDYDATIDGVTNIGISPGFM